MIESLTKQLCDELTAIEDLDAKIEALNTIRAALHAVSPFRDQPVDLVTWVKGDCVIGNDYNPNKVAKPEMDLLYRSIKADGYTQPIVSFRHAQMRMVVDGFHRNRVGKEKKDIREKLHGYLPVVSIDKAEHERMASTVRHNRARGKHTVELMSELLTKLINLGRSDMEICKQLGLTADELIRLKQQTGIASLFANQSFSRSWEAIEGIKGEAPEEIDET